MYSLSAIECGKFRISQMTTQDKVERATGKFTLQRVTTTFDNLRVLHFFAKWNGHSFPFDVCITDSEGEKWSGLCQQR